MADDTILSKLRSKLNTHAPDRVQSASLKEARLLLVVDVAGLDEAERDALAGDVRAAALSLDGVSDVQLAMTAERDGPPPEPAKPLMIAVGSGKGGVGKSTLTANLAVALARRGRKVGLVDADIYGPSQPMLFGTSKAKPEAENEKLIPIESECGVSLLSMGHLTAPGKALAWRGPMAGKALAQLINAHWDAEVLLVDLPPGTGDVQITMLQHFRPDGAVLVSTPQDLALIDAVRAGQLFDQGGIPVIGLVENMAGYVCPHCGEASDPFGSGGIEEAARRLELPFLGRVPLSIDIMAASDAGTPPAAGEGREAQVFANIAAELEEWIEARRG
ncbi:Mrp/NBP35 family ATP-binding protein [Altererythrobacter sp. HHU K3-1]|uniref:Iron-sulfur cluster carrier protein n=2 Tax=Qipengyuania atrilutea TaxID=2744473 RepID=A0A850H5X0_9SPHN|nr:Mrp/NBP35 family ATP-binding protein [Actirhodobacter atriluteus]